METRGKTDLCPLIVYTIDRYKYINFNFNINIFIFFHIISFKFIIKEI